MVAVPPAHMPPESLLSSLLGEKEESWLGAVPPPFYMWGN